MKKAFMLSLMCGALCMGGIGCTKKGEEAQSVTAPQVPVVAPKVEKPQDCKSAENIQTSVQDQTKITVDEYYSILTEYRCCEATDKLELKPGCVVADNIRNMRKNKITFPKITTKVKELMTHPSPMVRAHAYQSFQGILGVSTENIGLTKHAMAQETDLYALRYLIKGLSNEGNRVPEFGAFLVKSSKHDNEIIRQQVAVALANKFSNKVEGVADAVVALIHDPHGDVAGAACSNSYNIEDQRVLDAVLAVLKDKTKAHLHGKCLTGLVKWWNDYPAFLHHNEKAYHETMLYIKNALTTPETAPSAWRGLAPMGDMASSPEKYKAWTLASEFYNHQEVMNLMVQVVSTTEANWQGRKEAIQILAKRGGSTAMALVQPIVENLTDSDATKLKNTFRRMENNALKADKVLK